MSYQFLGLGLLKQLPEMTAMIPESDVCTGLEAALLVEDVRVGLEEFVALFRTGSDHFLLLLDFARIVCLLCGAGLDAGRVKI